MSKSAFGDSNFGSNIPSTNARIPAVNASSKYFEERKMPNQPSADYARTRTITMMQPVTLTENKQTYKTDDIGKEEYRGDDVGAAEEDIDIVGDTVIKADVPMYYDLYFDEDYDNWQNEYDRLTNAGSKGNGKIQEASKRKMSISAKPIEMPKPISINMQAESATIVDANKPAWMDGDPDYASFGRMYDQLAQKEVAQSVQMRGYAMDRIEGDSDYTNWQKAFDRLTGTGASRMYA